MYIFLLEREKVPLDLLREEKVIPVTRRVKGYTRFTGK